MVMALVGGITFAAISLPDVSPVSARPIPSTDDGGTGGDAPDNPGNAAIVATNRELTGALHTSDRDWFRFGQGNQGTIGCLSVTLQAEHGARVDLRSRAQSASTAVKAGQDTVSAGIAYMGASEPIIGFRDASDISVDDATGADIAYAFHAQRHAIAGHEPTSITGPCTTGSLGADNTATLNFAGTQGQPVTFTAATTGAPNLALMDPEGRITTTSTSGALSTVLDQTGTWAIQITSGPAASQGSPGVLGLGAIEVTQDSSASGDFAVGTCIPHCEEATSTDSCIPHCYEATGRRH